MSGTTIAGSYLVGLTLSNPALQDPTTITGTGSVNVTATSGSALYGTNAAAWSVYNSGTLIAPTRGVFLTAGGTITNFGSGVISGGYRGVDITGGAGTVTNAGSISSTEQQGIRLTGGGTVSNLSGGSISGNGTYGAVYIKQGGLVSNAAGGTIGADVSILGAAGTVSNAGAINLGNASTYGVVLSAGGTVSNTSGGAISGSLDGVAFLAPGALTNAEGGVISSGSIGIAFTGGGGTIVNAGTVTGTGINRLYAVRSVGGVITNLSSGVLSERVDVLSDPGTITNQGTIGFIDLHAGGTVDNATSGSIGGVILGGAGSVVNRGVMTGTYIAIQNTGGAIDNYGVVDGVVDLTAGGTISNVSGATISYTGRFHTPNSTITLVSNASLINAGTVAGTDNIAVQLSFGSSLENLAGGSVTGSFGGIVLGGNTTLTGNTSVTNAAGGTIGGVQAIYGEYGTIINDGVITGSSVGVLGNGMTTVVNAGTISGTGSYAVWFNAGHDNRLVFDPGAVFDGVVKADSGTITNTLELAAGSGAKPVVDLNTAFINFSTVAFDADAAWTVRGNSAAIGGVFSGFATGDTIDIVGLSETVSDYSAGVLTLTGDQTVTLKLPGSFTTGSFMTAPDAGIGTDVFLAGTTSGGSYVAGLTLSNPATQNPTTIASTTTIDVTGSSGAAIYGTDVAAWSIYNNGTLIAPIRGVFLTAGGTITNFGSGVISGGYRGVDIIGGTGTVTNAGSIGGTKQQGIRLGVGGTVSNLVGGIISGKGTYGAIYIRQGGAVSNAANATVSAGVSIVGAAGTVSNSGAINVGSASVIGVMLGAGGSVSNASGGIVNGSSAGIALLAAGTLTNSSGGLISGGAVGVAFSGGVGTVSNAGMITGQYYAVQLAGGTVTNLAGGVLRLNPGGFGAGVAVTSAPGTVSNQGTISGVDLHAGGKIDNASGGVIGGVLLPVAATVANSGTISQLVSLDAGGTLANYELISGVVDLAAGGTISNASSATITYGRSVSSGPHPASVTISGDATFTNAGTVAATGYNYAVYDTNGSALTNFGGGVITGGVKLAATPSLVSSITNAANGTIQGVVAVYDRYGSIVNDGLITGSEFGVLTGGEATLINAGTIASTGSYAVWFNGGHPNRLVVDPGAVFDGVVKASGLDDTLELGLGSGAKPPIDLRSSFLNFETIQFDPAGAWTVLGNSASLGGLFTGFAQGDTIDVAGLSETISDYTAGTLTLTGDQTLTLNLPGTFTTASFRTAPDAGTGTDVFLACYARGTRIATPSGEVAIEALAERNCVLLASGETAPIVWIGRRRLDCGRHPKPQQIWPVRVGAHAFGRGLPRRDLLLSPDHAVFVDDVLIPIRYLVNDTTIQQEQRRSVEYFHIELPRHAVLLAEGLPAESYLDVGDRSSFENGSGTLQLHPDFASRMWEAEGCAPLCVTGAKLAAVRRRLARIARGADVVGRRRSA